LLKERKEMTTIQYLRARKTEPKNYGEVPDDIILEDFEGNIVAHLMRECNNKGYYIIPNFKIKNGIKKFVKTYYEAYYVINWEWIKYKGLKKFE
jgi:hypothetical protein